MTGIEASVVIDRLAEEVWAHAKDIREWPEWQSGLRDVEVTSEDPIGVNTTDQSVARVTGRRVEIDAVIIEYEPPAGWCVQNTSGPHPLKACLTLRTVDHGTKWRLSPRPTPAVSSSWPTRWLPSEHRGRFGPA